MGQIPLPDKLTTEQVASCLSFSRVVFGENIFTTEPAHRGQHGWMCGPCVKALEAQERRQPAPQPWDLREAA